jgi:hypothetical protein
MGLTDKKPGGVNWRELMKLVAPVVGEVATGGDRGAFMSGFMRAQQRAEQRQQEQANADSRKHATGAEFLLKANAALQQLTDPIDFENQVGLWEHAGTQAGYLEPGDLRNQVSFNKTKETEAQLKEIVEELKALESGPHPFDLDELSQSGATIQLKSGKKIAVGTALEMTRKRPQDASGTPIAAPKKVEKPVDRSFVESQFDDLVALWKENNPGKEPPLAVRTQLRQQAQKQIGQADDRPVQPRDPALADLDKSLDGEALGGGVPRGRCDRRDRPLTRPQDRRLVAWRAVDRRAADSGGVPRSWVVGGERPSGSRSSLWAPDH